MTDRETVDLDTTVGFHVLAVLDPEDTETGTEHYSIRDGVHAAIGQVGARGIATNAAPSVVRRCPENVTGTFIINALIDFDPRDGHDDTVKALVRSALSAVGYTHLVVVGGDDDVVGREFRRQWHDWAPAS